MDDSILNGSLLDWLDRTGNAKVHGTTKRIPAEVFKAEREHLRPLINIPENSQAFVSRTVRKDNTIVFDSNRYSVPSALTRQTRKSMWRQRAGRCT